MVGRPVNLGVEKDPAEPGEVGLSVKNLSVLSETNQLLLDHVDLEVKRGEIVCVAGVQGNGQTELASCILGALEPNSGTFP